MWQAVKDFLLYLIVKMGDGFEADATVVYMEWPHRIKYGKNDDKERIKPCGAYSLFS